MTHLTVYSAGNANVIHAQTREFAAIARELAAVGARIERWSAANPVDGDAAPEQILLAYAPEIERLKRERGYAAADVISVRPGAPNWPELRRKFLAEHTHDDDEVRYFVEGSGAFYLHVGDRVLQVVGEAGDLLSVPRGVTHWFDGGERADFTCIRVFTSPAGWAANYTGERIAEHFPHYATAA